MRKTRVSVNELPIPGALLAAIEDGRWSTLARSPKLERVFGTRPRYPSFLSLDQIVAMNRHWRNEKDLMFIGHPSRIHPPGNIDPAKSLIIAELGPEQPIALDYRHRGRPRVLFAAADVRFPWRHVAKSVEELLRALS